MTRKITQISALSPGHSGGSSYHPGVLALADDGSVWGSGFNPETNSFDVWQKLPSLPATDEEAARLLAEQRASRPDAISSSGSWPATSNTRHNKYIYIFIAMAAIFAYMAVKSVMIGENFMSALMGSVGLICAANALEIYIKSKKRELRKSFKDENEQ